MIRNRFAWVLAAVLLASCQAAHPTPALISPTAPWHVQITPELRWIQPVIHACANRQANVQILLDETPWSQEIIKEADITLMTGTPGNLSDEIFQIGKDSLAIVVHPQNLAESISSGQLKEIFAGDITRWETLSQGKSGAGEIDIWQYSKESQVHAALAAALDLIGPTTAADKFVTGPEEMRSAVSGDKNALGFLPAHWVDSSVRELSVENISFPEMPVVAISSAPVDIAKHAWLVCLQEGIQSK